MMKRYTAGARILRSPTEGRLLCTLVGGALPMYANISCTYGMMCTIIAFSLSIRW